MLRLARGSFGDFLYLLMIGLVFLVPHQAQLGLAVALFALGASRGIGLLRQIIHPASVRAGERKPISALREIALPALASLGLIVVGVEVLRGEMLAVDLTISRRIEFYTLCRDDNNRFSYRAIIRSGVNQ